MRILLIDDEPLVLDVTKKALIAGGHQVETCTNGDDGIVRFNEVRSYPDKRFGMVITDLQMPGTSDGMKVVRTIRNVDADVRIIIMSARFNDDIGQDDLADAALKAGANATLSKPFRMPTLLRKVVELI